MTCRLKWGTATVAGVDVSGKSRRETVAVVVEVEDHGRPRAELVSSDRDGRPLGRRPDLRRLSGAILASGVELVAIDAPLTLPHAWTCERGDCDRCFPASGEDGIYTTRSADRQASWIEAGFPRTHPMPTAMLGPIAVRGMYLARALRAGGVAAIETWPTGVLLRLAGEDTGRPSSVDEPAAYTSWAVSMLSPVLDADWDDLATPDRVDAAAAAYAALTHLAGDLRTCTHVGDDGFICVPAPR